MFPLIENDCPALRDLANFVVPYANAKWYNLGLQLFEPQDELQLHNIEKANTSPQAKCIEVFHHWVTTAKKPTWNKLIKSLNSQSVNLPDLATNIEAMLDNRVRFCYYYNYNAVTVKVSYNFIISFIYSLLP